MHVPMCVLFWERATTDNIRSHARIQIQWSAAEVSFAFPLRSLKNVLSIDCESRGRGKCSLTLFEGHGAKCWPKSSAWGLILWLDVKLVECVAESTQSLALSGTEHRNYPFFFMYSFLEQLTPTSSSWIFIWQTFIVMIYAQTKTSTVKYCHIFTCSFVHSFIHFPAKL